MTSGTAPARRFNHGCASRSAVQSNGLQLPKQWLALENDRVRRNSENGPRPSIAGTLARSDRHKSDCAAPPYDLIFLEQRVDKRRGRGAAEYYQGGEPKQRQ